MPALPEPLRPPPTKDAVLLLYAGGLAASFGISHISIINDTLTRLSPRIYPCVIKPCSPERAPSVSSRGWRKQRVSPVRNCAQDRLDPASACPSRRLTARPLLCRYFNVVLPFGRCVFLLAIIERLVQ